MVASVEVSNAVTSLGQELSPLELELESSTRQDQAYNIVPTLSGSRELAPFNVTSSFIPIVLDPGGVMIATNGEKST